VGKCDFVGEEEVTPLFWYWDYSGIGIVPVLGLRSLGGRQGFYWW
jgi:hypothetical protein